MNQLKVPYGWRKLGPTEVCKDGDHYLTPEFLRTGFDPVQSILGQPASHPFATQYDARGVVRNVQSELPKGWRVLGPTEVVKDGDHYCTSSFFRNGADGVTSTLGLTAEAARDKMNTVPPPVYAIVREEESKPSPAPKAPEPTKPQPKWPFPIPSGYRIRADDEKIELGDVGGVVRPGWLNIDWRPVFEGSSVLGKTVSEQRADARLVEMMADKNSRYHGGLFVVLTPAKA